MQTCQISLDLICNAIIENIHLQNHIIMKVYVFILGIDFFLRELVSHNLICMPFHVFLLNDSSTVYINLILVYTCTKNIQLYYFI